MEKKRPVQEIEKKWQDAWEREGVYHADQRGAQKFYGLIEFPYPSGDGLHVGHPRSYIAMDIVTRKKRMEGKNVLYPIGWDAFGLPTENYAIKHKVKPALATAKNIANFTRQIKSLGIGFDWTRVVSTTDPKYYKWTQWQFLQFLKAGLAYKAKTLINWCPKDKIGLANEEVVQGCCERCGTPVEKREKEQWMIRITRYADRLLSDLDRVDYLDKIKTQQTNWIGKSEGAEIKFQIINSDFQIQVFTTRPDTIFGATYLVLAPEHPMLSVCKTQSSNAEEIDAYIIQTQHKTDIERTAEEKEKTGVELKGVFAINPASGKEIPIWVADYVLGSVGTGAIMAVPAHDERDFAFAKKFDLPVKQVVAPLFIETANPPQEGKKTKRRKTVHAILRRPRDGKILILHWKGEIWGERPPRTFIIGGVEDGEDLVEAAKREISEEIGYKNLRFARELQMEVHTQYFAAHKDENRQADIHVLAFELENEERENVNPGEMLKHEPVWMDEDEVLKTINVIDGPFIWNAYLKGDQAFCDDGVNINSDFLNDLSTTEAKQKMIAWLEEKGVGKKTTTYKLRDWIFSRQRYWGEPIPLVKCDACAKRKQKVLLIHGVESSAEMNWFPAMKARLEKEGFEVMAPSMKNADHPVLKEWLQELAPLVDRLGEDDVIVAHSLGARTALHLLAKHKKTIGHVYLVTPALFPDDYDWKKAEREWEGSDVPAFKKFVDVSFSWDEAGKYAKNKTVIFSDDDPFILPQLHETIPAGWFIQTWSGYGHMEGAFYPELEELVLASKNTGWIPVPDKDLPVELPDVKAYEPTDTGESPLANIKTWINTTCPRCGGQAKRETDTMPNWAGSSWYFLRYCDPKNNKQFASPEKLKEWMPVDLYNGGMEHTTLHLLYSRFWHKFLWDMGYVPHEVGSEPYKARRSHGLILAEGGEKMSKSKGNVINPDEIVARYGADVFRVYEMFMGPFSEPVPWDTNGIEGVKRFLDRVWSLFTPVVPAKAGIHPMDSRSTVTDGWTRGNDTLVKLYHQTLKKITEGVDKLEFNTCVSSLMILTNAFQDAGGVPDEMKEGFLKILAPFAPHLAEELWRDRLGRKNSIHRSSWPIYDSAKLKTDTFELVIQMNGKLRDKIIVDTDITEDEARRLALASEKVQSILKGKKPVHVRYVQGRLVSISF